MIHSLSNFIISLDNREKDLRESQKPWLISLKSRNNRIKLNQTKKAKKQLQITTTHFKT